MPVSWAERDTSSSTGFRHQEAHPPRRHHLQDRPSHRITVDLDLGLLGALGLGTNASKTKVADSVVLQLPAPTCKKAEPERQNRQPRGHGADHDVQEVAFGVGRRNGHRPPPIALRAGGDDGGAGKLDWGPPSSVPVIFNRGGS